MRLVRDVVHGYSVAEYLDEDDPGIMSEVETEATGGSYRRGGGGGTYGVPKTKMGNSGAGGSLITRAGIGQSLGAS